MNKRVHSIARRIHRSWQWKRLGMIVRLNLLALAVCLAAFLFSQETAVTGKFQGQHLERCMKVNAAAQSIDFAGDWKNIPAQGLEWLKCAEYGFTWQGEMHIVPLREFVNLAVLFGGGLVQAELVIWLLGFLSGAKDARRMLKPLDKMAETAQRLTDEVASRPVWDEEKVHDLENAIEKIDMGDHLSTGDKDLRGLENAINDLLGRMHDAYRQQARFVSDASHELRTPIAVIQGYVNMLDRWGKDDEKVLEESIAAIKSETAHMKMLVEQLLFLARGDSGRQQFQPKPIDLSDMMNEVLDEYRMIDEHHDWKAGKLSPAPACADIALMKQTARILTDNAVRYTSEGETIRFGTGTVEDHVYFEVQDSGIGIDEQDVPHIFDRFFRADPARARQNGGTGLGLSIAKWIVERHDGYFVVTSRPGIGTRIRVCLPKAEPQADAPEETEEQ